MNNKRTITTPSAGSCYGAQGASGSQSHVAQGQPARLPQQMQRSPCILVSRPDTGVAGKEFTVMANFFAAKLSTKELCAYRVNFSVEGPTDLYRALIKKLVEEYTVSHLNGKLLAYDGRFYVFTAGRLPFDNKEFKLNLPNEYGKNRVFSVFIKFSGLVPEDSANYVLDASLSEGSGSRYHTRYRQSFYDPKLGKPSSMDEGLESWTGFYQCIRPTQMGICCNVDITSTPFIKPQPLNTFVSELLNRNVRGGRLSASEHDKINDALSGMTVEVKNDQRNQQFKISGLTKHKPISVQRSAAERFNDNCRDVYNVSLLPDIVVGRATDEKCFPIEMCMIVDAQRYNKRLTEKQHVSFNKAMVLHPHDRKQKIQEIVESNCAEDLYVKEFGITISPRLAEFKARILPPPWLKFHDSGDVTEYLPHFGQWTMKHKKMYDGGIVASWICINFSDMKERIAQNFCIELANTCNAFGMEFNMDPVLPTHSCPPNNAKKALLSLFSKATTKLQVEEKQLDLLVFIMPNKGNTSLYRELKRTCETDLGVSSQCCLEKNVLRQPSQYLENLALKINVKVGGKNTVLHLGKMPQRDCGADTATIFFGADVSHPAAGDHSSPSIAAVVASQDWPHNTRYVGSVSTQRPRQEIIQDLFKDSGQANRYGGGMIRELLLSFYEDNGFYPNRIIFYRDGINDSQFNDVLESELSAIRKACASIDHMYQPPITFVVVQKRHHTKLFAKEHLNSEFVDRSGNIVPGTVVDSEICDPKGFDFYLSSHCGVKGTNRPPRYCVIWDDNNYDADTLQQLTYNLCYTYVKSTRSKCIVPPAHYAHQAASRTWCYMEPTDTHAPGAVRTLPILKDKVKRIMFYC